MRKSRVTQQCHRILYKIEFKNKKLPLVKSVSTEYVHSGNVMSNDVYDDNVVRLGALCVTRYKLPEQGHL